MSKNQFGLIGLAVMGQNLVLNAADHDFSVSVYNRTAAKTEEFMAGEAGEKKITPAFTLEEFVTSLERPRTIQIMVQAGGTVDACIGKLKPLWVVGDIILDGGKSCVRDYERRAIA
jgi:6-phosphogluconate dehydrogenase